HGGVHAHRAQACHLHTAVAVGGGKPFGKTHGGMLGGRIGRRPQLCEQTGRRSSRGETSAATGQPTRHHCAGGAHVCHHVHVPGSRPRVVSGVKTEPREHACIS